MFDAQLSHEHRYIVVDPDNQIWGAGAVTIGSELVANDGKTYVCTQNAKQERVWREVREPRNFQEAHAENDRPTLREEIAAADGANIGDVVQMRNSLPLMISGLAHADAKTRKGSPVCSGLLDYFPDACADVARLSKVANERHNPGQPMHWSRHISNDHADCAVRHLMDRAKLTQEGQAKFLHATMAAWRALAQCQTLIEEMRERGEPYPPSDAPAA